MDKILMLRYDIGDYVPIAFQRFAESDLIDDDCTVYFYLSDPQPFRFADEASFMCKDNIAIEQFYIIMFPPFDLNHYDWGVQDFIWECLMESEFENSVEEIIEDYPNTKNKRLSYAIEYEDTTTYESLISEGYFYIQTKGLQS